MQKQNKLTGVLLLFVIVGAGLGLCDYFLFTIKVHVPILGKIDTGVTKYELKQFEKASAIYDKKERTQRKLFKAGRISQKEFNDRFAQISMERVSDPRITAVTGGPAKKVLGVLLDKL